MASHGFLMNIINLPIAIMVAMEVVESEWLKKKGVSCCSEKKLVKHEIRTVFLKKSVSVSCSSLYPIVANTKV